MAVRIGAIFVTGRQRHPLEPIPARTLIDPLGPIRIAEKWGALFSAVVAEA